MEWGAKRRRTGGNDGTAGGASSTHTSTEVQEVATSSGYDYEVFLSFRGPDTRDAFTDYLYTRLDDAGIRTFKDDEELRIGEEFALELLQAINQSKISIPIFSKGYASSVWCLKELVQMVECRKNGRQKIMPIFYDVAPSVVRYQTGIYAEAFLSHEEKQRYGEDTIREWKAALSAIGAINGWDLHSKTNRREGEFAKEVTDQVFRELKKAYLAVSDCLVSIDNQVDEIKEMIGAQTSETRILGIHGMGGIGKTTIAKIIYNQLSSNFKDCCFLANIRETSEHGDIKCLQKQLISNILKEQMDINNVDEGTGIIKDRLPSKKVLLLLDDVEKESHIDAFVGKRDWFGRGSTIIITTRNKDILCFPKVDCSYELKCMDPVQSLKLFSKHAFRRDSPLDEDMNQSNRAIDIAKGLPLALEVIGSLLCRTKKERWDLTLKKLENVPPAAVQSKLKISYDALEVRQQDIFLDIACLFIGYDKDIVVHFWDENKFPEEAMEVLQNMSLIKIEENNRVWMHDQLRDLGREIVRQESKMKIEKQSRVWDPKEALDLLGRREGKKNVETLCIELDNQQQYCFSYESFENLFILRFLKVECSMENFRAEGRLLWHELSSNENSDLLPELRWLAWPNIPPTFNIVNFSMKNVVFLNLSKSRITHDWKGWNHMKVMENLKVMNLNNCRYLERTPNFSAHSKLERLILFSCSKLVEIDESICQLKRLVLLDVSGCRDLPRLPNTIGNLESLIELDILDTKITELPNSIGNLKLLKVLNISRLRIQELPHSIGNLESLIELDLSCGPIKELPDSIESLESLSKLDISNTGIKELPDSIGKLKNLKVVDMRYCSISKIPNALWTIEKLEEIQASRGGHCGHFDVEIGNQICRNQSLRILKLDRARIYIVPRLPESLTILELSDLYMNTFPDLSNLTNLEELGLGLVPRYSDGGSEGESDGLVEEDLPRWIGNLSKLEYLDLRSRYVTTISIDMRSLLPQLEGLFLSGCPNLRCLPSLPSTLSTLDLKSEFLTTLPTDMSSLLPRLEQLYLECPSLRCLPSLPSSLVELRLTGCDLSSSPGDLSNLKQLIDLCISDCAISDIRYRDPLENLTHLELRNLQQLESLPSLGNFNELRSLRVSECGNLVEIQGELPQSLEEIEILRCGSLKELPDLSSSEQLEWVKIKCCGNLNMEAISSFCKENSIEFWDGERDEYTESEQEDN